MIVNIPLHGNNIRGELVFQMKSRDNRGYSHMTRAEQKLPFWRAAGDSDYLRGQQ